MLGRRLISAFVIISVMLVLLGLDYWLGSAEGWGMPGLVLSVLCIGLATLAAGEMVDLWTDAPSRPNTVLVASVTFVMVSIACVPLFAGFYDGVPDWVPEGLTHPVGWSLIGLVVAFALSFGWEMVSYKTVESESRQVTDRLGRLVLVCVYLSLLFGFFVPHRIVNGDNSLGLVALIALIATVKLSDAFAYFAGKSLGTIKVAPMLSPKKTLQGSVGALVGGCVAAAIVVFLVAPLIFKIEIEKPWWWFLVYGILVTVAGMIGDLAESLLKRDAARKDSSSWLPGLGGLLDVLDSLIFAAPVSWLLWVMPL